ncbi:MAG: U32 family peptidase, partial [Planctomycetes bacterium]|nr:U32 family peptidase [Planctomycetota bacterium]
MPQQEGTNNSAGAAEDAEGRLPELLAPAGDEAALEAALDAGADAVYLGMTGLNARRRARNFRPEELPEAVHRAHDRRARVYLTLNTDIAENELAQAARMLELARDSGVDAVLVRDPALMALRAEYPELEFHFSTQTCIANRADVAAAGELGAQRAVLAREMTLEEIAAASAVADVKTEVFVQGALCFCVSGRCLLSSWVGGRSGNRGACTSPCRVPWTVDDQPAGTPLSMHDLATAHRLDDLRRAGVTALKIEGRLKSADWVRQAVQVYRRALDGETIAGLEPVSGLGSYTGRKLTSAFLDGDRTDLTGLAEGRGVGAASVNAGPARAAEAPAGAARDSEATYDLQILTEGSRVEIRCECREHVVEWSIPKSVVKRVRKAIRVGDLLHYLQSTPVQGHRLVRAATDDPAFLLVPRASNNLVSRISSVIHQAVKRRNAPLEGDLPDNIQVLLQPREPDPANRRMLDDEPDRARLHADDVLRFLDHVRPDGGVIVEGATPDNLREIQKACRRIPLVVALPSIFFENEISEIEGLVRACSKLRTIVEVNSWGGWLLARAADVRLESGLGLPVLNSLAAQTLAHKGIQCVTLSVEAGRKQLEELTENCPVSCSLVVFGRPALMVSRAELPEEYFGHRFEDRRGVRMIPRREGRLLVFRPEMPFDLRGGHNSRIHARHLIV